MSAPTSRSGPSGRGGHEPSGAAWQVGRTVLGEFVIERILGRGGYGEVVLAVSRRSGARYAVKRVRHDDPAEQGRLLAEAQRWIGLPPHPHITPCHFTRTVADEMAVFSEYAEQGSLADWIADGRLYARGPREALHTVLRVAVEAAYGLDAAHTHGLLHLDTKPANVLLTGRATARITDFGLATGPARDTQEIVDRERVADFISGEPGAMDDAARELVKSVVLQALQDARADEPSSLRAVSEGGTQGYVSPEQAEGRPLGPSADLWSWAATVLEMFTGGRTWPSGTVAGAALEAYLGSADGARGPVPIPEGVADLLRSCFRLDPDERPRSLREAADSLVRTAAQECGITLESAAPPSRPRVPAQGAYVRRMPGGASWRDPRELLGSAYQAAGLDPADAVRFWPGGHGSRAAQGLADLRALTEAGRVLGTVDAPAPPVRHLHALALAESGRVRHSLGDLPGAVGDYRSSVRTLETLDSADGGALRLAVLHSLAIVLRLSGAADESLAVCERVLDSAAAITDPVEAARVRGMTLNTKANAVEDPGERAGLHEQALAELRIAGDDEGVATALSGRAAALEQLGLGADADALWEQADALLQAGAAPGRSDIDAVRGRNLLNRAIVAGSPREAAPFAQAAVELYRPLVEVHGRHDIAGDLGHALLLTALGHEHSSRPQEALAAYRSARSALEQSVLRDGRLEYVRYLAQVHDHESTLVRDLEDPGSAVALARRAVEMWGRLGDTDGRRGWVAERAGAHQKLAVALLEAGEAADAAREFDAALRLVESAPGRADGDPYTRTVEVLVHRGRAVLHRRTGDLEAACREARTALDLLGTPAAPQEERTRVLCLQTLSAALGDAGRHEDSLAVLDAATSAVESLVERGEAAHADLADARQRQANTLLRLGYTAQAVACAHQGLDAYQRVISAGRADLVEEATRLRGALAFALQRSGDLDGAARTMQAIRQQLAEQAASRWQRVAPNGPMADAVAQSGDARSVLLGGLEAWFADIVEVRSVKRRAVPRLLATFERRRADLQSGTAWATAPEQISGILEGMCGSLVWLADRYPQDAAHEACVQTALLMGVASMRCGRSGAADRGFRLAVEHGRTLVLERGRTGHLEDWAKAHLALASWLASEGDDEEAAKTVGAMETHLSRLTSPADAARWSAHARQVLTSFRVR
ncbi:protein kinase domain-containing protein [Streptomyces sp. BP-8]|uniref:Serine/threonine-protein kinase n=1 Tax=Streptomyces sirii TaxID=3127701 RepID=A0ABZ2QH05_9ACTN